LCFAAGAVALLVAAFYLEENWRGRWASNHFKRDWEARGERFDLAAFVPAPVSDQENFLKAPLLEAWLYQKPRDVEPQPLIQVRGFESGVWQEGRPTDLREWRRLFGFDTGQVGNEDSILSAAQVLQAFSPFDSELKELYAAANERPRARFDFDYSDPYDGDDAPNHMALRALAQSLAMHASAALASGQSQVAWQDVHAMLRLADTLQDQHSLVSGMMRVAMVGLTLQPVWEGLASQRWEERQLAPLQKQLGTLDLRRDVADCLRSERAVINHWLETSRRDRLLELFGPKPKGQPSREEQILDWTLRYGPRGWIYQNELAVNRHFQEFQLALRTGNQLRFSVDPNSEGMDLLYGKPNPYNVLARLVTPNLARAIQTARKNQTALDQAVLACALERHQLAFGSFPQKLDALSPQFINRIPDGGFNVEYRRGNGNQIALIPTAAAGLDQVSGKSWASAGAVRQKRDGWVWQYPAIK